MCEPKTFAEQLDATRTGEEFAERLQALFVAVNKAKEDEEATE